MNRATIWAPALGVFSVVSGTGAAIAPDDSRSSAFVSGMVDAKEAFGQVEGPLLLGLAVAAVVAIFVSLVVAERTHSKCNNLLSTLESELKQGTPDD